MLSLFFRGFRVHPALPSKPGRARAADLKAELGVIEAG